jgi:hypothetical protein
MRVGAAAAAEVADSLADSDGCADINIWGRRGATAMAGWAATAQSSLYREAAYAAASRHCRMVQFLRRTEDQG